MPCTLNDKKKKFFLSSEHNQTGFGKRAQITHEIFGIIGNKETGLEDGVLFQHLKYVLYLFTGDLS